MTQVLRWTVMLCLVLGLTAAPQAESETDPDPDAKVGGTVISAKTGEPLRGARLTLQPAGRIRGRDGRKQTTTDLNGRFLVTELAAGEYTLEVEKAGYEGRWNAGYERRLKVAQGQSKTKLVVPMRPGGVITGRVFDSYGEPLSGARVGALRRNFEPGQEGWEVIENGTTNDLGEYRLFGLPMGKYIVGVVPRQEPSQAGAFILEQVPAFYPGVANPEAAGVLKVSWGSELDAIDLRLTPAPATVVSGILADADTGEPLEGYLRLGTASGAQLGNFSTTKDGRFVLYGLPQTELAIWGMIRNGTQMLVAHGEIHPSTSRVEEVELLVQSGRKMVSGTVVLEDPPEEAEDGSTESHRGSGSIHVLLIRRTVRVPPIRAQVPVEGGPFEIQDVQPGDYHVGAFGPPGAYLRTLARSGKAFDGFVITVPSDGALTDLELRYAFDGGTIAGTVAESGFDPDGSGAGARIVIIPDQPETSKVSTWVEVTDDGSFEITALPPGGYTLFAIESQSALDLWDPDVRQALHASGEHVSLKPNGTATIELNVIKEPDEPL